MRFDADEHFRSIVRGFESSARRESTTHYKWAGSGNTVHVASRFDAAKFHKLMSETETRPELRSALVDMIPYCERCKKHITLSKSDFYPPIVWRMLKGALTVFTAALFIYFFIYLQCVLLKTLATSVQAGALKYLIYDAIGAVPVVLILSKARRWSRRLSEKMGDKTQKDYLEGAKNLFTKDCCHETKPIEFKAFYDHKRATYSVWGADYVSMCTVQLTARNPRWVQVVETINDCRFMRFED